MTLRFAGVTLVSLSQSGAGSARDGGGALRLASLAWIASDQRFAAGPRLRTTEGGIGRFALFFEPAALFYFFILKKRLIFLVKTRIIAGQLPFV